MFQRQDFRFYGFRAARQVDDERFAAEDTGCTAEHPARGDAQAVVPHGLGDAGRVAVGHGKGGLRGDIPGSKAGAAGGEDQVDLTAVGQPDELGFQGSASSGRSSVSSTL